MNIYDKDQPDCEKFKSTEGEQQQQATTKTTGERESKRQKKIAAKYYNSV